MKKVMLLVSFIVMSSHSFVFAVNQPAYVHPHRVFVMGSGETIKVGIPTSELPSTCTNVANPRTMTALVGQNGVTQKGLDYMLSVVLTAITTKKKVYIVFDDSTSQCYIARMMLYDTE